MSSQGLVIWFGRAPSLGFFPYGVEEPAEAPTGSGRHLAPIHRGGCVCLAFARFVLGIGRRGAVVVMKMTRMGA